MHFQVASSYFAPRFQNGGEMFQKDIEDGGQGFVGLKKRER